MKYSFVRIISIIIGLVIGFFVSYLLSGLFTEYIRKTAKSEDDITQAAFLCILLVFPVVTIFGGVVGNWFYRYMRF